MKEQWAVKNAGVVLLNNYITMLFERLGLVIDGKFTTSKSQTDAVQYLQYVVTGLSVTDEIYLPLNKVLCGLPITHSTSEIKISEQNKKLIDGMIKAVIAHWPSIGDSAVNGFRGNWLVRDGILVELEDKWELRVEKRPYDILINKSPFSFSIIKHQWMEKPLNVIWPY